MTGRDTLELWGGIECTVNRVGDACFDQVRRTGHHDRPEDIARFAAIGFGAMRYPVLWERVAPHGLASADWTWTDARLEQLRDAGIRPIATLLHHGSGPRDTHLLDPEFPARFAEYAAAVAARYPWLRDYTPVNEPLTTARFSALYGHWYPHRRDDRSFVTALLHQLRGMVMAMAAIRQVNDGARLISTEDAGCTSSTPRLAAQAAFENQRRWLTTDLLCGLVTERHPLWPWLVRCGASPRDLEWFVEHRCPPGVMGLNYYLTSDRYLDERLPRYPAASHGGNRHDRYADVEAVRVADCDAPSHYRILVEGWRRYGIPVALTEVHAGCTREDQLRWFAAAWSSAVRARRHGVDVRAVTMWSLLGAFDWNSLVVRNDDIYEPGAFDVRSVPPRRTALARLAAALAAGEAPDPLARQPGWWLRGRIGPHPGRGETSLARRQADAPVLIAGGSGRLGSALAHACETRGLRAVALGRLQLDITSADAVRRALARWRPWALINAAGFVRVDEAEGNREACWQINLTGARLLAAAAAARRVRYVSVSTDLVFDGRERRPYTERDAASPLGVYGLSKRAAEESILTLLPETLIVRTAAFFGGPADRHGFLTRVLDEVSSGREVEAAADIVISPTYLPHLANAMLDLLIDGDAGIWHLANAGQVSWADFARLVVQRAGGDPALVRGVPATALGLRAARPSNSALTSARGSLMPGLDAAVGEYLASAGDRWRDWDATARLAAGG